MKIYLPANLDLHAYVEAYPPNKVRGFEIDKLAYLLSLIISVPAENKGILENSRAWVPLYSRILERRVHNYRQYFDYAAGYHDSIEREAIIEVLPSYHPGRSKSYRFKYPYNNFLQLGEWTITNNTLLRSLKKRFNARYSAVAQLYPNLMKWFDARRLKIDGERAREFAEHVRTKNQKEVDNYMWMLMNTGQAESKEMAEKPDPTLQYLSTLLNINRIEEGLFYASVDTNVRRFHSNLTNLKSEIRHFLTFDGSTLVSVDIANSQPFLSKALFNPDFIMNDTNSRTSAEIEHEFDEIPQVSLEEAHESIYDISTNYSFETSEVTGELVQGLRNTEVFHLSTVAPEIYYSLLQPLSQRRKHSTTGLTDIINSLIMFEEYFNNPNNEGLYNDIVIFFNSASNGTLYDEFAGLLRRNGHEDVDRKVAKLAVLLTLFTSNSYINSAEAAPKRLFRDTFPTVYRYFTLFKRSDKSVLARLLQSIESWLILDKVSARISKERPTLPIFTVHDSILTVEGNQDYVKAIMEDELEKHIGLKPTLKVEELTLDKLPRIEV